MGVLAPLCATATAGRALPIPGLAAGWHTGHLHPCTCPAQEEKGIKLSAFKNFTAESCIQNNTVPQEEEAILT